MSPRPAPDGDPRGLPAPLDSPEFLSQAGAVFARYPRRINALLSILQFAAAQTPLTPLHVAALARLCWATPEQGLLVARVYRLLAENEAAPRITVCMNVHCVQAGSGALQDSCRAILRGQPVIIDELFCFGHCTEGPCVEVNGRLITEATPALVLAGLRAAPSAKSGPSGSREAADS